MYMMLKAMGDPPNKKTCPPTPITQSMYLTLEANIKMHTCPSPTLHPDITVVADWVLKN